MAGKKPLYCTGRSVVAGGCLALVVEASDLGDDPLTFSLDVAPAGMSIDAVTGLLTWYPEANQVGSYNTVVRVSDGGLSDTTQVALTVSDASQDDKVAPVVVISGAKQVEPACASLNSGDVFLLDTGAILYQVTVTATQPPPADGRYTAAAPAWLLSG